MKSRSVITAVLGIAFAALLLFGSWQPWGETNGDPTVLSPVTENDEVEGNQGDDAAPATSPPATSLQPSTTTADGGAPIAAGTVEHVVHVSIDGLASRFVSVQDTPNLMGLMAEGTSTLNARTDADFTRTMPNHFSQLSGRPVLGEGGHGIDFNQWDPAIDTNTVHDEAGEYVASVFDVVHDNGLRTAAFVSKEKMEMIELSWGDNGAADLTGEDNGTDKIDAFERTAPVELMSIAIDELETNLPAYTFIHIRTPDEVGHRSTWGSPAYLGAVAQSDGLLGDLIAAIQSNDDLANRTAVIVTSDHGGPQAGDLHDDQTNPENFTIPFVYWGPTVAMGADFYDVEAGVRTDPGTAQVPNARGDVSEPIRDHDSANLALELLGLPAVPGSQYNLGAEVVEVTTPPPAPDDAGAQPDVVEPELDGPDTTAPVVELTSLERLSVGVNDLSGTIVDTQSGADTVRVLVRNQTNGDYWNGNGWQTDWVWNLATLTSDDTWTFREVNLDLPGRYSVLLWGWDNEDNLSEWNENPQSTLTVG